MAGCAEASITVPNTHIANAILVDDDVEPIKAHHLKDLHGFVPAQWQRHAIHLGEQHHHLEVDDADLQLGHEGLDELGARREIVNVADELEQSP